MHFINNMKTEMYKKKDGIAKKKANPKVSDRAKSNGGRIHTLI